MKTIFMKVNKLLRKRLFGLTHEIVFIYSSIFLWGGVLLAILLLMDRKWL